MHYRGTLALRAPDPAAALDAPVEPAPAPVFPEVKLRPAWWRHESVERRLSRAAWLESNDEEPASPMTGDDPPPERACRLIARHGIAAAIVTLSTGGAALVDRAGNRVKAASARLDRVLDTVGAGDAYAAVGILGPVHRRAPDTPLERAGAFAARVVGQRGAVAGSPAPCARPAGQRQLSR